MISVIIVNYNAGRLLSECVQSVLSEVDEVLIVDNASSDSSIKDLMRDFSTEKKLKIIQNDKNLGFSAACNLGYVQAKGDFILFFNPDGRVEEKTISTLLQVIQSDSKIGMVGGFLVNEDGSEQGGGRRAIPTPWRSFVRAFGLNRFSNRWPKLFYDFHLHKQDLPLEPITVEAISGACMLVKREAVTDVGLWDEEYFLHCEDLDWCMRFRQKNWKIIFVPSAKIVHALGACSKSRPYFVEWHKHKGMLRFYNKFFRHQYPGFLMTLVTAGVWMRFSLVVIHRSLKRPFG